MSIDVFVALALCAACFFAGMAGQAWLVPWLASRPWKPDSESAACLVIEIAQRMNAKHLREIADYMEALAQDRDTSYRPEVGGWVR